MPFLFERHCLVWCNILDVEQLRIISDDSLRIKAWFAKGLPAIVRRTNPEDLANFLPLGICVPNSQGRKKISFGVNASSVVRVANPPLLNHALESAPDEWKAKFDGGPEGVRVYGGLMWQHITGEAYLRSTSDLDLIFPIKSQSCLNNAELWLAKLALLENPRVDGEFTFPGNLGVAWREWLKRPSKLLVKSTDAISLVDRSTLLGLLESNSNE